jgi:hypothetical protein
VRQRRGLGITAVADRRYRRGARGARSGATMRAIAAVIDRRYRGRRWGLRGGGQ